MIPAMPEILVAVPVLGRPQMAAQLVESCREGTTVDHRIMFLCSPGDTDEIDACRATEADEVHVVTWQPGPGDYAKKINYAVRASEEPWILMGADDICFCPGWAENALQCGQRGRAGVIGTQDWGNPRVMAGFHSTHPLVRRSYIEEEGTIDEPGKMLHEGYHHAFCDDELCGTAMWRRKWVFCAESEVPHNHPDWGLSPWDSTYEKGRASINEDRELFMSRKHMWRGGH
jgi:hypothetical protein